MLIGITGGIGVGKTYLCSLLKKYEYVDFYNFSYYFSMKNKSYNNELVSLIPDFNSINIFKRYIYKLGIFEYYHYLNITYPSYIQHVQKFIKLNKNVIVELPFYFALSDKYLDIFDKIIIVMSGEYSLTKRLSSLYDNKIMDNLLFLNKNLYNEIGIGEETFIENNVATISNSIFNKKTEECDKLLLTQLISKIY